MKPNSRTIAVALPEDDLPMSRNALVMQSGGGGGVGWGGVGQREELRECLSIAGAVPPPSVPC